MLNLKPGPESFQLLSGVTGEKNDDAGDRQLRVQENEVPYGGTPNDLTLGLILTPANDTVNGHAVGSDTLVTHDKTITRVTAEGAADWVLDGLGRHPAVLDHTGDTLLLRQEVTVPGLSSRESVLKLAVGDAQEEGTTLWVDRECERNGAFTGAFLGNGDAVIVLRDNPFNENALVENARIWIHQLDGQSGEKKASWYMDSQQLSIDATFFRTADDEDAILFLGGELLSEKPYDGPWRGKAMLVVPPFVD